MPADGSSSPRSRAASWRLNAPRVLNTPVCCRNSHLNQSGSSREVGTSSGVCRTYPSIRAPPASLRSWAPTLAVFDVPAARPTGLAVTPVASTHDKRFTSAWQRLPNEPDLLREYNAIKLQDQTVDVYEERKSAFFDRIAKC